MSPRARSAHRGFTLIEVLIAMSIMAIVAIMSWQGVDAIVRARDVSETHLNRLLRLNTVLAQFKQDLASVHGIPDAFQYDGARLTLVRDTPGGVQVVVWALRNDAWFRWAGPVVTSRRGLEDQRIASRGLLGNERGQLKAFAGISQIQIYCGRSGSVSNCQSSSVSAPAPGASAAEANQVDSATPDFVQLQLTFAPDSGLAGTATRAFLIRPL